MISSPVRISYVGKTVSYCLHSPQVPISHQLSSASRAFGAWCCSVLDGPSTDLVNDHDGNILLTISLRCRGEELDRNRYSGSSNLR